ncbi:yeeC-like protein [Myroides odoratimimus]|uniref:GIY-YIG nuclease family protein n=1 Tax=Myroides odoratimimus TaxID=76832 RepID=UPI000724684D|nr:GIY-YIG nuclease family protein [Myroides odoratimimus]GAQ12506.1 yeeC-like protein [Myroides odoratimimus]STZ47172.1 T5orf172 domain [Myroides odoratimimus]
MAKSLDDIFNDDDFGLLESQQKQSFVRTDEDRLIDSFEEINLFFEKHNREPSTTSMSEYTLSARLKGFRANERNKSILKTFDRFNLLGEVELKIETLEDILGDDDLGLLDNEGDTSIFEFKYTPKEGSRTSADYIAQRKSISERDFQKYDQMFKQVHKELKEGKRKLLNFTNAEDNLIEGNFYLVDGILCYLEVSNAEKVVKENKSGDRIRLEGRTVTIFENGTISNMLFRSLGKAIQKNGKIVTNTDEGIYNQLQENFNSLKEEDIQSGWIYVLKSKSENPEIQNLENLYKIGFSKNPVHERIKNASKEATYLFADVEVVASYICYSLNVQFFENLLHRFFAEVCLNVDLYDESGNRFVPREWFVVPLHIIDEVIQLLLNGSIINYRYNVENKRVILK